MPPDAFIAHLKSYRILTDNSIHLLCSLCGEVHISRNGLLLTYDTVPGYYYYVESGLFAYYYLTDNGDQVIKRFFLKIPLWLLFKHC